MTASEQKFDIEAVRAAAEAAADENGMCRVVALIDGVKDNGHLYQKGREFHMHKHLVPGHAKAGQVRLADEKGPAEHEKQQAAPKDKQFTGGADK